jgi:hypothetical protein
MASSTQNLTFNVLTFKHPSDEYTFHFSNEEVENSYRVFHTLVPLEVKEHFGEQEHYFTQYTSNHNGLLAVTKKSKSTYILKSEGDEKPVKETNASFLSRLVIHFYKQINHKELDIIWKGLHELNLNIPVFIVSINKTKSHDVVAFDNTWKDLMPYSGTFINFWHNRFLLFNNTRYNNSTFRPNDDFPFPIKLSISCAISELEKDYKTIKKLLDQVYQFSRIYWKSVKQQNLPVTIKYPEMVASIYQHFDGDEIPTFGKDNLWFL